MSNDRDGLTEVPFENWFKGTEKGNITEEDVLIKEIRKKNRDALIAQAEKKVGVEKVDNVLSSMDQMTNVILKLLMDSGTVDPDQFTTIIRNLSNVMERRSSSGPGSVRLALAAADAFLEESASQPQAPAVREVVSQLSTKYRLEPGK